MSEGVTNITIGDLVDGFRGVSYQPEHLLEEPTETSVILLRANNIQNGQLTYDDIQIVPNRLVKEHQFLQKGDIVVCMSNGSKMLVGKSAQYNEEMDKKFTIGAFCSVFKPKKNTIREFIRYLFGNQTYQHYIDIFLAGSAINNLKNSDIEAIPFSIPSIEKQRRIGTILSTLDQSIEKTEALIHKYQQIKAGLMYDLFTRGLTADGKLRPPREQAPELYQETLIGWIPKAWDCVPVSDLCSQVVDCPHSTPSYQDSGIPCIRTADMEPGQLLLEHVYRVNYSDYLKRVQRLIPQDGDIIYSREGERLGIASPVGKDKVCLGQRVMLLRPGQGIDPDFLLWSMNLPQFYRRVVRGLGATTSPHVNVGDIKEIRTYRPPEKEQIYIGKAIKTVQLKLINEKVYREKLITQKSGLMHDLLTGKFQVKIDSAETVHGS